MKSISCGISHVDLDQKHNAKSKLNQTEIKQSLVLPRPPTHAQQLTKLTKKNIITRIPKAASEFENRNENIYVIGMEAQLARI